ncbi:MAG: hypothetical protein COA74_00900 [Gammaproteobacteria bacterium]|nr:MAG: hypothetical protein COA74_00900 [Gammaproteobacteria bacterium]
MNKGTIAIALATFNGESYLEEQINSILSQSYESWDLYICDDGSSDSTPDILIRLAKSDSRINIIEKPFKEPPSHYNNFHRLLTYIQGKGYPYFALCDQDDVWATNKLSEQIKILEKDSKTTLCHSDLSVVNEHLNLIHESFCILNKFNFVSMKLMRFLMLDNFAVGCTIVAKTEILEHAIPFPENLTNHDWWLAICAELFGEIKFLNQPLVLYRQHQNNQIGSTKVIEKLLYKPKSFLSLLKKHRRNFEYSTEALLELNKHEPIEKINMKSYDDLNFYLNLIHSKKNLLKIIYTLHNRGYCSRSLIKDIVATYNIWRYRLKYKSKTSCGILKN